MKDVTHPTHPTEPFNKESVHMDVLSHRYFFHRALRCESAILELGTLGHILITASQELILGSCCSSSSTTTWSRVVQIENSSAAVTKSLWIEQQLLYRQEETSKEKINVGTNLSCHAGYKLMEAQMILWVQTYEDTIVGLWKGFGILCHSLWRENINGTSSLVSCLGSCRLTTSKTR